MCQYESDIYIYIYTHKMCQYENVMYIYIYIYIVVRYLCGCSFVSASRFACT